MPELKIEITEDEYRSLSKLALLYDTTVEEIARRALRYYLNMAADIDSRYHYKLVEVPKEIAEIFRGVPESKVAALARLATIIYNIYGSIPRRVSIDEVKTSPKLEEAIKLAYGRSLPRKTSPEKLVDNLVRRVKSILGKVDGRVHKENGMVVIEFRNPDKLLPFIGYGSQLLNRRIRRKRM